MDAATDQSPISLAADLGLIPVVVVDSVEQAAVLGPSLVEGGLPIVEVTLRTESAIDAIRVLADVPGLVVGAGTVINASQLEAAVLAGARFVVSPGISATVIAEAQAAAVPIVAGVSTATELQHGLELGLTTMKFFPASTSGGPAAIAALSAPFPQVRFVPTGGISLESLPSYLRLPSVLAVGGSWMTPRGLLAVEHRAKLVELISTARAAASEARRPIPTPTDPKDAE